MLSVNKVTSVEEAMALVQTRDTVATSGFVGNGTPDALLDGLARAFETSGAPRELTLVFAAGQGDGKTRGLNRVALPGLVRRAVGGHWGLVPKLGAMAVAGEIEAYNLPQGCISQLYRDIAAHKPGTLSRVGLGTFVDPRLGGGKVNTATHEDLVELLELHGVEWLLYKVFPIHVALLRGTTADTAGNVTMERESLTLDNLAMAMAAKNSGGLVIVQVERVAQAGSLSPRAVKIPGALVDCVAVARPEHHWQTYATQYNPVYSGETRGVLEALPPAPLDGRKVVGRRAALELLPGSIINLGIGMPEGVAAVAQEEGLLSLLTLTAEPGVIGGLPASGLDFGAAMNTEALIDQNQQFDFYDGGGLDLACLGMAQCDALGNVNVSRFGSTFAGCGGFINISQNARRVVFVGTFTCGGLEVEVSGGKLRIVREGKVRKFIQSVEQVSFSAAQCRKANHEALYVTERCVFRLTSDGLELTEVAPGVTLDDIFNNMDFVPSRSRQLATMDARLFLPEAMGLRHSLESRPLKERILFDALAGVLFINFAGLSLRGESQLEAIASTVELRCAPLARRVPVVVNYDGCTIAPQLMDAYAEMVERLTERFYSKVTRYTSNAFLRLTLGHSLASHHVAPHLYGSSREAFRALASAGPAQEAAQSSNNH